MIINDLERTLGPFQTPLHLFIKVNIGTLGVHVSAQRNFMVTMKKISLTIISKHLYFEVTIQLFSRLLAI